MNENWKVLTVSHQVERNEPVPSKKASVSAEKVFKARSSQAKSYIFAPTFPVLSQGKSESREGESLPNL